MEQIQYIGETLWPKHLGHLFVVMGLVSCLFACLSYFFSVRSKTRKKSWKLLGRSGFTIHCISVVGIISVLFYVMTNQMYEYQYAWDHVSDDLPMKYIFSAFWEGQEGSFLLWMFWHIVLGSVIILRKTSWESTLLSVLMGIQFFISSMILGLYFPWGSGDFKIGSNPVLLLRDTFDAPIFANTDYLSMISGNGLNPLLQNYWMTIHPPVLFLGFAACSIPFCYAISGLWLGEHRTWLKPGLKWAFFAAIVLGTGVLMGGAWAYEALSFGGYWAWDPVENTSLVPWLVLIAGIHTNLIANKTGYSIKSSYIFYILAFILILYSTFLTRSGILGDTSVHAFTEMGLENQLVIFILFFSLLSLVLYLYRVKGIPVPQKEEHILSREFWMFIGSIILFFSATLITVSTSLPVFNSLVRWIYDPDYIGMVIQDPISHYNKYQLWIAVFIGILSALSLYLRYKMPSKLNLRSPWLKFLMLSFVASLALSAIAFPFINRSSWQFFLLCFSGIFAIISNIVYIIFFLKGNLKLSASAFSHLGFGCLILGILISGLNSSYISTNPFAQRGLLPEDSLGKNIQLIKGAPFFANNYWITYETDSVVNNLRKFKIDFKKIDDENRVVEQFDLWPNAVYSNDFSKIAAWNPDTKHYLHKDIFTNITGYPRHLMDINDAQALQDSLKFSPFLLNIGDTVNFSNTTIKLSQIIYEPEHPDFNPEEFDLAVGLELQVYAPEFDSVYLARPLLALKEGLIYQFPMTIDALGLRFKIDEEFFNQVYTQENFLDYSEFNLKETESTKWEEYTVTLTGFNRQPEHPNYAAKTEDIALSATMEFMKEGSSDGFTLNPIYIIRNNQQFSIKDYLPEEGIHIRFNHIDPGTATMQFTIAKDKRSDVRVPVFVADQVPRSDIIILEAKVFPGIKLVWTGSILMLFGLALALWNKFRNRYSS